jgi:hypothetical protein
VKQQKPPAPRWPNRTIGTSDENPEDLLANPFNWKIHAKYQQDAVEGSLDTLGWVDRVRVNQRTGHILNGHLRVTLALRHNEQTVPVEWVDLTEEEEALALVSLDPLGALAGTDSEKLDDLLGDLKSTGTALDQMLEDLAVKEGIKAPDPEAGAVEVIRYKHAPPPRMAWVVIGIPVVKYGAIAELVERVSAEPSAVIETVVSERGQDEAEPEE